MQAILAVSVSGGRVSMHFPSVCFTKNPFAVGYGKAAQLE